DLVAVAHEAAHLVAGTQVGQAERPVQAAGEDEASVAETASPVTPSAWLWKRSASRPVPRYHTRTVLSAPPETAQKPSGSNATAQTESSWPERVRSWVGGGGGTDGVVTSSRAEPGSATSRSPGGVGRSAHSISRSRSACRRRGTAQSSSASGDEGAGS